jgi:archaellum component FlaC
MDALAALSAQWEADQKQQADAKAELDGRLHALAQQVTDFAGQHEKQAAALQEQLEHLETQVGLLTKQYADIAQDYKALAALLAQV